MTSEKNRTAPNTFARYIENTKHRSFAVLHSYETGPDAEQFPCTLCGGEGVILKTVKYSRLRNFSGFFKDKHENDITGKEVVFCPTCHGSGVDEKALVEFIQNQEVA